MGFEPTITVFEQAKTVHALDGAATAISKPLSLPGFIWRWYMGTIPVDEAA
jgi:hypothetical protein